MKRHFLEDANLLHHILLLKRQQINLLYPFLCFSGFILLLFSSLLDFFVSALMLKVGFQRVLNL